MLSVLRTMLADPANGTIESIFYFPYWNRKMHNPIVQFFTATTVLLTVPIIPPLSIPALDPELIQSCDEMVIGKPQEKLEYLLNFCKSSEEVDRLAKSFDAAAKLFEEQHEPRDAEVCYLIAIRLMRKCLPANSIALAEEYERLAVFYSTVEQGEMARIANLRALQIYRANGRDFAIEQAILEHNQAWLELYVGKKNAAEGYLKHCLILLRSALGENHFLVGMTSNSLGEVYMCNGKFVAAEKFLKAALKIIPQTAGMDEVTNYVQENYNLVLQRLGRKSEMVVRGKIK